MTKKKLIYKNEITKVIETNSWLMLSWMNAHHALSNLLIL